MSEKVQKPNQEKTNETQEKKVLSLSCACCNQDIRDNKFIGIVYYGTMIHLCGEPCGVRDYLETQ